MNKKFKFTISSLNNLPKNPATSKSTELEFSDTEVIGLKCLVGKTGNKRFLLRYMSPVANKKASIGLGRWPDIDLLTVRKKARGYKQQVLEGIDPKLERDNKAPESTMTLERFFEEVYLPLAKQKRTWKDDVARFRHAKPIHHIPIHELTAADIVKVQMTMQEKISKTTGKPYAVASINRVLALLKTINKKAYVLMDCPLVADKVSLLKEDNVRTGYLSESQLKEFIGHALRYSDKHTGAFLALLFLTGLRDKELRFRLWNEVNLQEQTLTIPHTKNGSSHIIYLSDYMVQILESLPKVTNNPYIFAGRRKGKPISPARHALKVIKNKMGLPDIPGDKENITLHSARHTVGSLLASQGVPLHDIAKQLNHADLSSSRRYSKLTVGRRREIGSRLSDMVTEQPEIRWE